MSSRVMCLPAQLRPLISLKKLFSHLTPMAQGPEVMAETLASDSLMAESLFVDVHGCRRISINTRSKAT